MKPNGLILLLIMGASGCASQNVTIRSWPPETPAADNAANIAKAQQLIAVSAVAATSETRGEEADAARTPKPGGTDNVPLVTAADAPSMDTYDPWARLNRATYRFNARFDEAVFLPVANGYRRLPSPLRSGVHNFFGNLSEIDSVINYTLQGRLGRGVRSLGRFVINSTIGIGGLFDVATKLHLANSPTGFGTTLAKWGMHPGPYLVIPFFGPSTLREGIGLATDYGTSYAINVVDLYRGDKSWGLGILNAVDQRANTNFRYYATGSPFEYSTIRFLYVRKLLLEDAGLHRKKAPTKPNPDAPAGQ